MGKQVSAQGQSLGKQAQRKQDHWLGPCEHPLSSHFSPDPDPSWSSAPSGGSRLPLAVEGPVIGSSQPIRVQMPFLEAGSSVF